MAFLRWILLAHLFCASCGFGLPTSNDDLPIIDLGYAKHRPTYVNVTASGKRVLVYKNIRFAEPPIGDLRFRKPVPIKSKSYGIQDGDFPQHMTECIASAPPYVPYLDINGTTFGHEDCLFLDVYVPEGIRLGGRVPVLHSFFGSAYAFGSKDLFFTPIGLFDAIDDARHNFIFVANNYRLGMPGWTSAPGEDLDVNVGLNDCIAAMEWTKKYIKHFGGDADQITAMGQSAGSGIISLMITGNGGRGELPFQQAFLSSPAVPPRLDTAGRRKQLLDEVLKATNCTDVKCLRSVPEETMLKANHHLINELPSTGGGGNLGPVIGFSAVPDGDYFPDLHWKLFKTGRYHKSLKSLIVGTMDNEGMTISSDRDMPGAFPALVRRVLPTASNDTISRIKSAYRYPLELPQKLAWDWTSDINFACDAYHLSNALQDRTKRYIMSIPPAVHGEDVSYYFFVNNETTPVSNVTMARNIQHDLTKYVAGEDIGWPVYGKHSRLNNITASAYERAKLERERVKRCDLLYDVFVDLANGV